MSTPDFARIFQPLRAGDALRYELLKHRARHPLRAIRKERGEDAFRDDNNVTDLSDDDIDQINAELGDADDDDDDSGSSPGGNHVSHLADLICEATGASREDALRWLMSSASGQALVARTQKRKEQTMKYKHADIPRVMKGIADSGRSVISEADATAVITCYAKSIHPNDRPDVAFSKVFTSSAEPGPTFRKAVAVAKGLALIIPVSTDGGAGDGVDDPVEALRQLQELAAEQHRRQPETSLDKWRARMGC
jgi:hypothetical protein